MSSENSVAVGYVRVSTERQAAEGVSLDAQKEKILAWAQANDYELLELFVDAGLSGSRADNRPGLQRAVSTACKRKAALVVYSLSRLARSTKDALVLAERLNKAGADLVSLTESIDTTSASGKMVYRMLSVLNEFQRDLIAEHTAEALAFKARNGQRFSRFAPFGYRFSHEGDLDKDQWEQETIRQVHELRRRGLSIRKIGAELAAKGVFNRNEKPLSAKAVFKILKRAT
ncbi:MAG: recombinase family protein [Planctomycetes bacterium]|nr:recombinase family protein [Planctomycetota bacterium]